MISISRFIKLSIFFIVIIGNVNCWDSQEMQMFDLVEELKENFYDFLGVSQNATSSEIGKAYRKLTLRYHPDRNPGAENAVKFRQLVSIYEILKDDQLRERYNDVLKHGLPDWRMPSFYYRKLRKMPLVEIIALFSILATLIHYACLWGVYMEKKLDMEDYLNKLFRRRKVHDRKKGKDSAENEINQKLKTIPKPVFKDILPFAIVMFIYSTIKATPHHLKILYNIVWKEIDKKFAEERKTKAKAEERKKLGEMKKLKKERKIALSKEQSELRKAYELAKKNAMMLPVETFSDVPLEIQGGKSEEREELEPIGEWKDENTILLIKALTKYPSGVRDRWIKISEMVKRPISEVTDKVKEIQQKSKEGKIPIQQRMQSSLGDGVADQIEQEKNRENLLFIPSILQYDNEISSDEKEEDTEFKSKAQMKKERKKMAKQSVSSFVTKPMVTVENESENIDQENVAVNEDESNCQVRKKPRKKASYLESESIESNLESIWTQTEQKQLEDAMRTFPNGTTNRWDRIAQKIPTKSKAQCIDRIKKLSQAVQLKQSMDTSTTTTMTTKTI